LIHGKLFQAHRSHRQERERRVKHIMEEAEKMLMDNRLCITCGGRIPQERMSARGTDQTKYCRDQCRTILYRDRKKIKDWKAQGFTVIKGQLKLCSHCKNPIPKERGKKAKYCGDRCRVDAQVYRRKNIPTNNLCARLRKAVRKVMIKHLDGGGIKGSFRNLPYTQVEFIEHLAKDWPNGFPKDIENYHIDHIKPLNHYKLEGKLETEEDVVKAFALENLRLISASENLSRAKGKRLRRLEDKPVLGAAVL